MLGGGGGGGGGGVCIISLTTIPDHGHGRNTQFFLSILFGDLENSWSSFFFFAVTE